MEFAIDAFGAIVLAFSGSALIASLAAVTILPLKQGRHSA
jgi:hypothetical protein